MLSVDPYIESIPLKYHDPFRASSYSPFKLDSMIHAKELRYGNKVQTQEGQIITVQQILSNSLIYDTQITVGRELAMTSRSYSNIYSTQFTEVIKEADLQDIDPIVLTPKILGKCGFRNFVRDEWIFSTGNSHMDFVLSDEGLKLRHTTPCRVSIRYLHQLQNFMFAIAGCELDMA